ncbi:MAG TPA: hypothetical protein PLQ32_13365 [Flavihumibacter sp.]|nr:hypothetical protein [Flavihumibacter sp.]
MTAFYVLDALNQRIGADFLVSFGEVPSLQKSFDPGQHLPEGHGLVQPLLVNGQ